MDTGLAYGITIYDAIYVSLAKIRKNALVTADRKLVQIMGKTNFRRLAWRLYNIIPIPITFPANAIRGSQRH